MDRAALSSKHSYIYVTIMIFTIRGICYERIFLELLNLLLISSTLVEVRLWNLRNKRSIWIEWISHWTIIAE